MRREPAKCRGRDREVRSGDSPGGDWHRGGCDLFPTDPTNTYGFVADSNHRSNAGAVEASPEFAAMWAAFVEAAGVMHWGPVRCAPSARPIAEPGDGPLASPIRALIGRKRSSDYETGALGRALGLNGDCGVLRIDTGHHIALDESWNDVRTLQVIANGSAVEVLLRRRWPGGASLTYRTAADGVLRRAVHRPHDHLPLVELPLESERVRFAQEVEAWRAEPLAEEDEHVPHSSPDDELRRLFERIAAPADVEALSDALLYLNARGIFVAEAMNQAPPHVVRRVVRATLLHLSSLHNA